MANSDKNIRITTSKNKTTYPNIVFTGSAAGSSVITLEVLDDNTLSFTSNEGQVFSIDSNLSTGTIWAVSDISGIPLLSASAGGTIGLGVYGGLVAIGQTNPTYKLDLKGSFGLASSNDSLYNFIFSNSAASGSNSLQIRSANSLLLYNSGNTFYTGFKSNAATNITYTLPTTDGSSGQFLQTNGSAVLTWATATGSGGTGSTAGVGQGGQYEMAYYPGTGLSVVGSNTFTNNTATGVVSITHSTVSTDFSNGAFKVTGGVGIGGSLYVGGIGASIVGVTFSNSSITRGTWNGTAISPTYGGTGLNNSSATGLLQYSSGTASVITTSSALASIISDETGTAGKLVFSTSPVFTTDVTTDSGSFSVFNTTATTINAFGAATTLSVGAATGKFTHNSTDNSSSISTGSVVVLGGAGIAKSVSVGGYLQLFNGANYTSFVSSASGNTVYTLPATSPATGSSVLQSTSAGVMSWVPMVASSSGAGSGTVAIPGAQYQVAAYYSGTGASVSGSTTFTNNTSTGVVAITHNTASTSTGTGALVISGGLGIAGNAFIGGTINVPSTSTSNVSNILFTNGTISSGTWAGTVITSFYGGTGFNSYTIGDILVASTGTSLAKLPAGSTNFVLTSNGTGTVPSWQAVPSSAASSVAVTPTTLNQSFFITAVSSSNGSGLGLSTITTLVINPSTGIVTASGLAVTSGLNASTTTSAAFTVLGGLGITGNAFIGGTASVTSTQVSISSSSGALVVTGGVGIGGSLYTSTGSSSSVSGVILANGNVSATTYNKLTLTAPATSATLTLANGSSLITSGGHSLTFTTSNTTSLTLPTTGTLATTSNKLSDFAATTSLELLNTITGETGSGALVFATSPDFTTSVTTGSGTFALFNATATTINAFGAATVMSIGAATGKATFNSTDDSSSTTTGSLAVSGGAGFAKSVSVGGRLQMFNGANFTAFVSSASGNTVYTLPATSPATGSSVLQSTSTGVMSWVPMTAGGGPSGTINSSTVNNIAYYSAATTLSGDSVASGNYFQYTGDSRGLVIANVDAEFFTTSGSTKLLTVGTGATNYSTNRKALAVISTNNAWTNGDLLVLGVGALGSDVRFGVDWTGRVQIGTPGTGFTLPATNGTSGQVLTANTDGKATWTTVSGSSGAGSGTVAIPGAQYQVAAYYHSATGASVSGSTTFTNNTSTGVVNITHATESTSSTTGAITITGGAGIAKSLFVGTTLSVGQAPGYNVTNNLASFVSTVNTYNQVVIQNKSNGAAASADFVLNNDSSTDTTFYGNFGMNSSAFTGSGAFNTPNAVYVSATSGPLVLGTTTSHPIRFVVNSGATDTIFIHEAGTAISVFTNLDLRAQNDIRFFNADNSRFAALQASNVATSYTLSLPTAPVGAGASLIMVGSDSNMYFVAQGSGIAFSSATSNAPIIRAKRPLNLQFASGFNPLAAGSDTAIIRVPESATDGTTVLTYNLRRFQVRVETPSAGSSRLQLERSSTDTGAFTLAAAGSSHIGGLGVTISGAGIYLTSVSSFSGSLVTSGNLLRLNWTLLNTNHANFSVQLLLEEV